MRSEPRPVYIVAGHLIVARELARIVRGERSLRGIVTEGLPQVSNKTPVICLLDAASIKTPLVNLLQEMAVHPCRPRVVVISVGGKESLPQPADLGQLGVWGWLMQEDISNCLIPSILLVARGMCCLPQPPAPAKVFDTVSLSAREKQAYELLQRRFSDREIAESLGIRINTAKSYVSSVFRKLGVRHRRELAADRVFRCAA